MEDRGSPSRARKTLLRLRRRWPWYLDGRWEKSIESGDFKHVVAVLQSIAKRSCFIYVFELVAVRVKYLARCRTVYGMLHPCLNRNRILESFHLCSDTCRLQAFVRFNREAPGTSITCQYETLFEEKRETLTSRNQGHRCSDALR